MGQTAHNLPERVDINSCDYVLSVRVEDRNTQLLCVEHFEVGIGDGGTYFVERNRDFSGFSKLIDYYISAKNCILFVWNANVDGILHVVHYEYLLF